MNNEYEILLATVWSKYPAHVLKSGAQSKRAEKSEQVSEWSEQAGKSEQVSDGASEQKRATK